MIDWGVMFGIHLHNGADIELPEKFAAEVKKMRTLHRDYNKAALTFDFVERKISLEGEGVRTTWLVCCRSINEGHYKCLELNTTDYNYKKHRPQDGEKGRPPVCVSGGGNPRRLFG